MNKIVFEEVKKSFGAVMTINGLNLCIAEGEVYALLGHNGAEKLKTIIRYPIAKGGNR